jgi:RNA polymerase sigma-70 factor (ECF subfamily)
MPPVNGVAGEVPEAASARQGDPAAVPGAASAGNPGLVLGVNSGGADVAALVPQYQTPLLRYVGALLHGDKDQAQDLVQEAFLRLHRHVQQNGHAGIANPSAWLFRVAHNLAMDVGRKRVLERPAPAPGSESERTSGGRAHGHGADGRAGADGDVLEELVRKEACTRAMAELQRLPDDQKSVLLLKIVEGMTLREIAQVTGLTVGNAAYRVNQGLRELSRRLTPGGKM